MDSWWSAVSRIQGMFHNARLQGSWASMGSTDGMECLYVLNTISMSLRWLQGSGVRAYVGTWCPNV